MNGSCTLECARWAKAAICSNTLQKLKFTVDDHLSKGKDVYKAEDVMKIGT